LVSPRRLLAAALPLALLLAACSAPSSGDNGSSAEEPRAVEVRMSDELTFDPEEISVTTGETVRFEVTNDGATVHEFLIGDEAAQAEFAEEMAAGDAHGHTDAGVTVQPGETETFEYTFEEAGSDLLAGCHEPGHYDAGMVASITVTDPS